MRTPNHAAPADARARDARTRSNARTEARLVSRFPCIAMGAILAIVALAPSVQADACEERGKNVQCNGLGVIKVDNQSDIKGSAISIPVEITLHNLSLDLGSRWLLFSVWNATADRATPVSLSVERFTSAYGDVPVSKTESEGPAHINLWANVLDVPLDTRITLLVKVGATDRGAYRMEVLVMPFERGYAPIHDESGAEVSLYSFSLLAVDKPSGAVEGTPSGGTATVTKVPGFAVPGFEGVAALAAVAVTALAWGAMTRRRAP